ncbi:helix-turn-helix domain-containing protein [Microbacterium betulae]|uniref:Helix-turn-helix domain-containing protein n=1 Tax=Microbacterium betulae TaxID=2981139 RepID=A0AA97FG46_9MICO|nr:helix-turn-helix domain-containing protein [Microbacterium sp. AB]WOF21635.1 helix-turn-helix domain-containing protein [Microbacterium sp. AB]
MLGNRGGMAETGVISDPGRPRAPGRTRAPGRAPSRAGLVGGSPAGVPRARTSVFRRLLDEEPALRERALEEARGRRWLAPSEELTVSVLGGARTDVLRALGIALQTDGRGALWRVGELAGSPVLVCSSSRADDAIRAGARRRGHPEVLVGTATLRPDDDDLLPAAEEALLGIRPAHGVDGRGRGIDPLPAGVQLLLSRNDDVPLGVLRRASPGAFALWIADDAPQLETVEVYLDAGARVSEACGRLHVHRTTLYYRLENLPPVVREELEDGLRRSTLHLVLKLLRRRDPAESARALRRGSPSSASRDDPARSASAR